MCICMMNLLYLPSVGGRTIKMSLDIYLFVIIIRVKKFIATEFQNDLVPQEKNGLVRFNPRRAIYCDWIKIERMWAQRLWSVSGATASQLQKKSHFINLVKHAMRFCCAFYSRMHSIISMPANKRKRNAKLRVKCFPWIAIGSMRKSISNNLSGRSRFLSVEKRRRHRRMVLHFIRRTRTTASSHTRRTQGEVLCSFIYFIEESRYIYRHKSEPTPPPTTMNTKMMMMKYATTHTHTHIHNDTTRNEQLIKFQLKKAEFCAKNEN